MAERSFLGRVNYAHEALLKRKHIRAFDDCFENYDGSYVVASLMRRAAHSPELMAAIEAHGEAMAEHWRKTAAQLAHLRNHDALARAAANERRVELAKDRARSAAWAAGSHSSNQMELF
jgi:hypothetical protein